MKRMHSIALGVLSLMVAAAVAQEPRYWLEQGEGYPVCRDFLANLNAFPPAEQPQMCEQKIHPMHPEFTWPVWEELDIEANLRLIHAAESLLRRFTPIGAESKPFEEWEPLFRERVRSGQANPRLRRTPFMLRENEPETFIWYEPVRDECEVELKRTGFAGEPGGHIFVLRARTGKVEDIIAGTQGRDSVVFYRGQYPYLMRLQPDTVVVDSALRPIHFIGIGPVLPPNDPPENGLPYDSRYAVESYRCHAAADRDPLEPIDITVLE